MDRPRTRHGKSDVGNMLKICGKYVADMARGRGRNAQTMSQTCAKHVRENTRTLKMWKICSKHVENMWKQCAAFGRAPKVGRRLRRRPTLGAVSICFPHVLNMFSTFQCPRVFPNMFCTCLRHCLRILPRPRAMSATYFPHIFNMFSTYYFLFKAFQACP